MIATILSVLAFVGLVTHIVYVQGHVFDLQRLLERMQQVETQTRPTHRQAQVIEPGCHPSWSSASEDVDREIIRARDRNRS